VGNLPILRVDATGLFSPPIAPPVDPATATWDACVIAGFGGFWVGWQIGGPIGEIIGDAIYPPPPVVGKGRSIDSARRPKSGKERVPPEPLAPPREVDRRPPKNECNTALKLLKEYERLMKKAGKTIPPKRLKELDDLQNSGNITYNDLPAHLKGEFPDRFKGMKLKDIEVACGKK
jgi:hypothetical protein